MCESAKFCLNFHLECFYLYLLEAPSQLSVQDWHYDTFASRHIATSSSNEDAYRQCSNYPL